MTKKGGTIMVFNKAKHVDKQFIAEIGRMHEAMITERNNFVGSIRWKSVIEHSDEAVFAVQNNNEPNSFNGVQDDPKIATKYSVKIDGLHFYKDGVMYRTCVYGLNKTDKAYAVLLDALFILFINGVQYKGRTITISDENGEVIGSWYDMDTDINAVIADYNTINKRLCRETENYLNSKEKSSCGVTCNNMGNMINKSVATDVSDYLSRNPYIIKDSDF